MAETAEARLAAAMLELCPMPPLPPPQVPRGPGSEVVTRMWSSSAKAMVLIRPELSLTARLLLSENR